MNLKLLTAVAALVACSGASAADPWELLTFNCVDRDSGTEGAYKFFRFNGESDNYTESFSYKMNNWHSNADTLSSSLYNNADQEELRSFQKIDRSTGRMRVETYSPWGIQVSVFDCELRPENKF